LKNVSKFIKKNLRYHNHSQFVWQIHRIKNLSRFNGVFMEWTCDVWRSRLFGKIWRHHGN